MHGAKFPEFGRENTSTSTKKGASWPTESRNHQLIQVKQKMFIEGGEGQVFFIGYRNKGCVPLVRVILVSK